MALESTLEFGIGPVKGKVAVPAVSGCVYRPVLQGSNVSSVLDILPVPCPVASLLCPLLVNQPTDRGVALASGDPHRRQQGAGTGASLHPWRSVAGIKEQLGLQHFLTVVILSSPSTSCLPQPSSDHLRFTLHRHHQTLVP